MHLNELSRPGTREEAETTLMKGGYERVAGGTYGVVYGKPGASTILKLMHKKDVAYMAFVTLALKHQDNPHFPRFSGKLIRLNDDYRAVRMERLVEGKGVEDNYRSFVAYALDLYIARKGNFGSMMPDYIESIQKAFYENPQLQDACDLIIASLGQYQNDLHPGNVMFRGSTVVIIDPVAPHTWQADVAVHKAVKESYLEGGRAPLYHFTNPQSARYILEAGKLTASLFGVGQVCTTRDKNFRYNKNPVRIELDGDKVRQNLKVTPFDYTSMKHSWSSDMERREEREERINGDVPISAITGITVYDNGFIFTNDYWIKHTNALIANAKRLGIPLTVEKQEPI